MAKSIRSTVVAIAFLTLALPAVPAAAQPVVHPGLTSENPQDDTPHVVDGRVNAIVQTGNLVIAAGNFDQVRNSGTSTFLTRRNIFAFDATTGVVDPDFNPNVDGVIESLVLSPNGQAVYLGGVFNNINGTLRRKVAKLSASTGNLITAFEANFNAEVLDLEVANDRLYVAGAFTTVNGSTGSLRSHFAALDLNSGAVDPNVNLPFTQAFEGDSEVAQMALSPDGSRLVAIGNFRRVNGKARVQLAVLNLAEPTAKLANWKTSSFEPTCSGAFDSYPTDVDVSPDGTYFAVTTTGAWRPNLLCDTVSRWELNVTGTSILPTWIDWAGGDTTYSVSLSGHAVYVGGHFRWWNNPYTSNQAGAGAVPREGIAALDPVNGLPFDWDPGRDRGVGVFSFVPTDAGLWVGSDTDTLGHENHEKIGFLPLAGGVTVPPSDVPQLPNDLYVMRRTNQGQLFRYAFDGTTLGPRVKKTTAVNWNSARGAFTVNDTLYTGWSDGTLLARSFDGTTLGAAQTVDLHDLDVIAPGSSFRIPGTTLNVPRLDVHLTNATGMFFDQGRLYYTVQSDPRLYYRYFTPSSRVVGAMLHVADTTAESGIDWGGVRGMTMAGDSLFLVDASGVLSEADFGNGDPSGPPTSISGPGIDGETWTARGLFVLDQLVDTFPPSTPGTPTAASVREGEVDLAWQAATDSGSDVLTYRVFRNGTPAPIVEFDTADQGQVTHTDVGLTPGAQHTYTVEVEDAAGNTATSAVSNQVTVLGPDTLDPTGLGTPTGVANGKTKIDLQWQAATDDRSTTLTYRVLRDGDPTPVGEFDSAATGTIPFTDTGLDPGSTHTYVIEVEDEAGNTATSAASAPITTGGVLFADDFSSGNLAAWDDIDQMTIDNSQGGLAPPSARYETAGNNASLRVNLPAPVDEICMSARIRVFDRGTSGLDLLRVRTAGDGKVTKTYVNSSNVLVLRSELAATQKLSGTTLPTGWNELEMCGEVGTTSTWDLYLNGTKIVDAWQADVGTTDIGRIQIGDTNSKTATANWDDVVADGEPN
ncbi:MAG: hypothetical protein WD206_07455 [Actinomycetota bacterium]